MSETLSCEAPSFITHCIDLPTIFSLTGTPGTLCGICVIVSAFCLLTGLDSLAQDAAVPPDSTIDQVLQDMSGEFIELETAIARALENATAVKDAEANLAFARAAVSSERGSFDPEAFVSANRSRSESPTASPFSGASVLINRTGSAQAGIRSTLPFGTSLEASMVGTRTETNSAFTALNPQYDSFGRLSFTHPLLAGGGSAATASLNASRHLEDAAVALLNDTVINVTATVQELYWDLYAAERNYAVQRIILSQARALLNEADLRARAGLVGPSQVENAKVFLAEQELAVLDRDEDLDRISDALVVLVGSRPEDARRYRPTEDPPPAFPVVATGELIELALSSNEGLNSLQEGIRAAEVELKAERRNRLPTVDLVGSLSGAGLSGAGRDVIFGSDTLRTTNTGDFVDALRQAARLDFPSWEVGVNVRIPLTGRSRNSGEARQRAEVDRLQARYDEAKRLIEQEVRRNHRALQLGADRLRIAQRGVTASQEQVRIGLIAYRNGQTTAFEIVRLGADLAAAQRRFSQALVRNAKAIAALQRLTSGKFIQDSEQE